MAYDETYFARVLKSKRALKGWDQDTLATESGVSKNSIARYETSDTTSGFDATCKLAEALDCSTDDFWKRETPAA